MTLDFDEAGRYLQNGVPFTGQLYLEGESGSLEAEQDVRDGFKWGAQREWNAGLLALEWFAVKAEPHGPYRAFHANGKLASEKTYEFGVCIAEQTYDESGAAKESWKIGPKDADFAQWHSRKAQDANNPEYK